MTREQFTQGRLIELGFSEGGPLRLAFTEHDHGGLAQQQRFQAQITAVFQTEIGGDAAQTGVAEDLVHQRIRARGVAVGLINQGTQQRLRWRAESRVQLREQLLGTLVERKLVGETPQIQAIVRESIGGRETQNLDAETLEQMGGQGVGIITGDNQIRRQHENFFDRAVIDRAARRTRMKMAEIGVA